MIDENKMSVVKQHIVWHHIPQQQATTIAASLLCKQISEGMQ
jgi:hypothetical protein